MFCMFFNFEYFFWCFMDVSIMFQACFEEVARIFKEGFKRIVNKHKICVKVRKIIQIQDFLSQF